MSEELPFLDAEGPALDQARATGETPAEPTAAQAAEPAAREERDNSRVPIGAMLGERDKRMAAERRLAELEAKAQPPAPPEAAEQFGAALYAQNLRSSRKFAEREYGKPLIETVHDWAAKRCDADPEFNRQMRLADDPYEAAMQAYDREQILASVSPKDLDAFKAWQAAQAELQAMTDPQQPAPPPPRSLATAPGNGGAGKPHVQVGEGEAFSAAFS
ncbi:MAG TPA: hypothetical protein VII63_08445 [Caulobacteraceae bacterium]